MSEQDDRSLDQRMDRMEESLEEISISLWQIREAVESLKPQTAAIPQEHPAAPRKKQRVASSEERRQAKREAQAPLPGKEFTPAPPLPQAPVTKQPLPVPNLTASELHGGGGDIRKKLPGFFFSSKFWFNIIGVALVLLGVIFLYKYSVDQGWINSEMKVAFGMAIGAVLLVLGLYLHGRQRFFSQMMVGAGIATFYITGYAAYQVYDLIPFWVSVAWLSAVTLAAFVLALQQREQVLALVATIGGLTTPFLMHQGLTSKAEMVLYVCAILTGAVAIYFYKGWRPLLWVAVVGGWLSLLFIYDSGISIYSGLSANDKLAMQAGVIFAALGFWAVPILRELLAVGNPVRWSQPYVLSAKENFAEFESVVNRHVHALSVSTPFLALFFTRAIWSLTNREWGFVTLGAAALIGLAFVLLNSRKDLQRLAYTQALVDLSLLTMALALIFDGDARFVAITAEATALHLVGWKLKDKLTIVLAHSYFIFLGAWLFERLMEFDATGTAIFNRHALSNLLLIVLAAAVSFILDTRLYRYAYQVGAYVGLLALFLREFSELQNGQGYVTVAWGACAIALLVAGIILAESNWRAAALVTLFIVVGKLVLVDLAAVKPIWRVLLFIGFGALFLVLSYFFQSLWKPPAKPGGKGPVEGAGGQPFGPTPQGPAAV